MRTRIFSVLFLLFANVQAGAAEWPTHRGNLQRTGCADGKPGPAKGKVLWIYESNEHFLAAPVAGENAVYVSSLGAFNTAAFRALSLDLKSKDRELWKKSAPYLRQAMVSSPAVVGGKIIFGDGMHQTDGATLHCLSDGGAPLWQLGVPGTLVHLEGAPHVEGGNVFIGGGAAGVLCVDLNRVTLEGNEKTLDQVRAIIDKRWKEMTARYEKEKKVDPDFAIPPNENSLPKAAPKVLWQAGAGKWHVDSSLAVAGENVLAGSGYLDQEKEGLRAMLCLDARNGEARWTRPLKYNPWGGPSVAGDVVIVGCSSVRLDPNEIKNAQGEVVAISITNGAVKWRKEIPAGVVSSVCVSGGRAIFTATDGKVRALDVGTGSERWAYTGDAPFFAGPAVAGLVYAADMRGVVHGLDASSGALKWKVELPRGNVYGSPVVAGGRLYVATANLDQDAGAKTAVVCIGD